MVKTKQTISLAIPIALCILCGDGQTASAVRRSGYAAVTEFELWDANTNEKITTLLDGAQIPMREGEGFNVKAIVHQRIGSLLMSHNGQPVHVENSSPYFFCADNGGNPHRCTELVEGDHIIEATPYPFPSASGPAATSSSVSFSIVPSNLDTAMTTTPANETGFLPEPETAIKEPAPSLAPTAVVTPVLFAPIATTPANETGFLPEPETAIKEPAPSLAPTAVVTPVLFAPIATTLVVAQTTKTSDEFSGIRINCGGPSYTDAEGNVWSADKYFVDVGIASGTFILEQVIAGTTEDALYHSERWGLFQYEIPVPPGDYQVILQCVDSLCVIFASSPTH
jgi:Malectin domain